ncbi:Scr1 family TA system antitoxin-like transcriptional regulator [Streptomyces sp. NPDC058424]|uniref:helix-turn-helix domain-containing protein n=1 Tax=Streptomyces sp. NPDC058424 TaxID=3346491 RepID=UPI00365395F2
MKAFGAALKVFRERALLTQEQLAERLNYSHASVASVEQGRRMPTALFVERAEEALESFGVLRAVARHVGRQRGLAVWFREWAQLEETAVSLCTYECRVVPGLLQTEAYTRAVMRNVPPPPTEEQLQERIAARLARQELLTPRPPVAFGQKTGQLVSDREAASVIEYLRGNPCLQAGEESDSCGSGAGNGESPLGDSLSISRIPADRHRLIW